jgi:hypothetical protein
VHESVDCGFNLVGVTHDNLYDIDAKGRRHSLNRAQIAVARGILPVLELVMV